MWVERGGPAYPDLLEVLQNALEAFDHLPALLLLFIDGSGQSNEAREERERARARGERAEKAMMDNKGTR